MLFFSAAGFLSNGIQSMDAWRKSASFYNSGQPCVIFRFSQYSRYDLLISGCVQLLAAYVAKCVEL